ncbi:Hypothetical protein NTJ_07071 [Nesidiocoris tenuis]|uniref:Uncharacterized protein n=1 Tax=Nesidiocoris tenuis TaxID=355587 RepID=A0ABN7ASD6_9HEMI|nr:Hypothetical protein NTJ_07071 [Nesidiocoris tenuis]
MALCCSEFLVIYGFRSNQADGQQWRKFLNGAIDLLRSVQEPISLEGATRDVTCPKISGRFCPVLDRGGMGTTATIEGPSRSAFLVTSTSAAGLRQKLRIPDVRCERHLRPANLSYGSASRAFSKSRSLDGRLKPQNPIVIEEHT